jgi:hypothetical protein
VLERSVEPVRLVSEPKPGGIRWLAHLSPVAAATYAAAVVPLVPAIEAALPPNVVANRVTQAHARPPTIRLEAWSDARARFRALVDDLAARAGGALVADVHDFYGSVAEPVLAGSLDALGCGARDVRRAVETLRRLSDHGVRGLPIGPAPSAVLANAVLSAVDVEIATAGFRHVRWVDDVLVFADDAERARDALDILTRALERIGLRPAAQKTRVLADPRTLVAARTLWMSVVGPPSGGVNG